MKDGNVRRSRQAFFNWKTARRCDVFEADRPKRGRQQRDTVDDLVRIQGIEAEWKGVHACKSLQQHRVPLHDRHGRVGPRIAEVPHLGPVGNESDGVSTQVYSKTSADRREWPGTSATPGVYMELRRNGP